MFLSLRSLVTAQYADQPYLVQQKARIAFFTLIFAILALIATTFVDMFDGNGSILEAILFNCSSIPILVFGMVAILRGSFQKVIGPVLVGMLLMLFFMSILLLSRHPELFYASTVQFLGPIIVASALFGTRRLVLLNIVIALAGVALFWLAFCDNTVLSRMLYSWTALAITSAVTYGLLVISELSIYQIQIQLDRNIQLNDDLEQRVKERTQDLEEARDLAERATIAKSEFLANMSHEIRTPLNGILGMAQLLSKKEQAPEDREFLQVILDSGRHLLSVIQDVLDYSKIESGKIEIDHAPLNLDQVLSSVRNIIDTKCHEKGLFFIINADSNTPNWLIGDEVRIRQVLMNLAANAVKFTENGGIYLNVILLELMGDKVKLRFQMADTGIGMNEEGIARIFERFTQAETSTSRRFGGTGLGLTISRELLQLMNSEIRVISNPNQGSTFEFELVMPIFKATQKLQLDNNNIVYPTPNTLRSNLSVLVVEDNALNMRLSLRILKNLGYQTEYAENGKIGLEKLRRKRFSLVLMDCQMPVMDGYAATQVLRSWKTSLDPIEQHNAETAVIGLTADALKGTRASCLEAGMDDYLSKPFKIEEFESLLVQWTNR